MPCKFYKTVIGYIRLNLANMQISLYKNAHSQSFFSAISDLMPWSQYNINY